MRYLATAHTADDQAETALHHILRGTGLRGLGGMRRVRPLGPAVTMVRPMLSLWRSDVASYLTSLGQPYREDCSNRDMRFTRNRIRHELLPRLEADYGPKVRESLVRLAGLAADAERVIETQADHLIEQTLVDSSPQRLTFDRQKLAQADRHLLRQAMVQAWRAQSWPLGAMGFADWDLLADMIFDAKPTATRQTLPGAINVRCTRDQVIIERSAGA
jgi:tRNA(Ile)-lysidine synthase